MKKQTKNKNLTIFEGKKIRRHYDEKTEKWYFSVVDIVAALTEQNDFQVARSYWKKLAQRLRDEGSQVVTKCHRLKMLAQDGKMRVWNWNKKPAKRWLAEIILRFCRRLKS